MTDLGERTLKCYLLHTSSIADESEFEDWYQQRHRRLAEELEYKSTLAEVKAWLSGWLEGWRVHRDLLHLQRPLAPHLAELLEQ